MVERAVTLTMTRLPWWLRLHYRWWLGIRPPEMDSNNTVERLRQLLPYWPRRLHHWIATNNGYFWLPCPLCGREFGGHEWGDSIPDPTDEEGRLWTGICTRCTRNRSHAHRPGR